MADCRAQFCVDLENLCNSRKDGGVMSQDEEDPEGGVSPRSQMSEVQSTSNLDGAESTAPGSPKNGEVAAVVAAGAGMMAASQAMSGTLSSQAQEKSAKYETATDEESGSRGVSHDIRAQVFMISGCKDKQTSADVSNVSNFSLPVVPNGVAGGACTSALLQGT